MEIKELRIGNFVNGSYYWTGEDVEKDDLLVQVCRINGLDQIGFSEHQFWVEALDNSFVEYFEGFEGISITEKWLLDFGFNKSPHYFELETDNVCFTFDIEGMELDLWVQDMEFPMELIHIKHVHQLQNLYFALTNKELTIKI